MGEHGGDLAAMLWHVELMKILIFGGSGMLGHRLWVDLSSEHDVWVTVRTPATQVPDLPGVDRRDRAITDPDRHEDIVVRLNAGSAQHRFREDHVPPLADGPGLDTRLGANVLAWCERGTKPARLAVQRLGEVPELAERRPRPGPRR